MKNILCGVDIGGTKLSVALVNCDGKLIDKIVVLDHIEKGRDMVQYIVELIQILLHNQNINKENLEGIGMCFAGHINYRDGVVITTSNMEGMAGFRLRDVIQEQFNVRVILDNDANAQAYAEFKYGAGVGCSNMVFVTISTGIGGGIIINNKLYRGRYGTAGEFGHTIIDAHSEIQCTCGNFGCFMACASGLFLPQIFNMYLAKGFKTKLNTTKFSVFNGKLLKDGLDQNDEICIKIVNDYANYIGIGVYNIFQIFDPQVIILGGGLMNLGKEFLLKIKKSFNRYIKKMSPKKVDIVLSQLSDSGVIGAATLLLEE